MRLINAEAKFKLIIKYETWLYPQPITRSKLNLQSSNWNNIMKLKDLSIGRSDLFKIDPRILQVEPGFNVREDSPRLREAHLVLKASIKELGVQRPFIVRLKDDQPFIVDGHRRFAAVSELISEGVNIVSVPCLNEGTNVNESDRALMIFTTQDSEPLTALEKGTLFKRLVSYGMTEEEIGRKTGIGSKQVENLMRLTAAPVEIREMVSGGSLSATQAMATIREEGAAQAVETLKAAEAVAKEEAVAKGLDPAAAKVTAKVIKKAVAKEPPAPFLGLAGLTGFAGLDNDPEPEPVMPNTSRTRLVNTPAKFKELVDTLHGILETEDVNLIYTMCRDALNIQLSKAA